MNIPEKKKQAAAVIFLLDRSRSLTIADEVNGQKRWAVARKAFEDGRKSIAGRSKDLEIREYLFDSEVREGKIDDKTEPIGDDSAIGSTLLDSVKRQAGMPVAMIVLISDGANNAGSPPVDRGRSAQGEIDSGRHCGGRPGERRGRVEGYRRP